MSSDLLQLVVGGILLGGLYGLAAFGLSVSFGVLNVLNLAHGEFLMLGALAGYGACLLLGVGPFMALLIVAPLFMVVGVVFYLVLLRPLGNRQPRELLVASVLVTLGVSLAVEDVTSYFWERPVTGIAYAPGSIEVAGIVISELRLLILVFLCVLAVALQVLLKRTYTGRAIRAIVQSREGAKVVGIPIAAISAVTFGLSAALAACAGVLYATLFTVSPVMGIPLTVKYLCVVVLGGLGSLVGSVVGGLTLGLAEALTAYCLGTEWAPCISFILLISILVSRPSGMFGERG